LSAFCFNRCIMIKLSQRLASIASYAENSKSVADVGTDHGHIPVWLAQHGYAERITASDIKKGPLESARIYAAENEVSEKIEFVLTDGLKGLDDGYDTVIIAGMGGETIVSILEAAPWTKNGVHLVLQPQSKVEILLKWLYENGYVITDGSIVKDAGKLYMILSVVGGNGVVPEDAYMYVDHVFFEKKEPLLAEYIRGLIKKNIKQLSGLEKGGYADQVEYIRTKELDKEFHKLMKEAEKWQK